MLQRRLIPMFIVLSLTLSGVASAAVSVFHNETCVAPYTSCTAQAAVNITTVTPATVPVTLFYQNSDGATPSSDPNTRCLSGNGDETCGWDIHVSSTSPTILLTNFIPDTGPGSDIVWAITGNVLRMNGGIPTTGELGIRRLGILHVTKQSSGAAGSVNITGNLSVDTDLAAIPLISGNTVAIGTGGVDTDLDGIEDSADNCPTVSNASQTDGTVAPNIELPSPDGVGDACDNCVRHNNPRVWPSLAVSAAAYVAANPWATLSGDQRDDDHDGYGNKCDADFTVGGATVGPDDLAQYRPSSGKARSSQTACGSPSGQRCARFDLNEAGATIGPDDLTVYRSLSGKAKGPRCATHCTGLAGGPLGCISGTAVTCTTP